MTIIVTWMDGLQETYRCEGYRITDGVLTLQPERNTGQPTRSIPITNMRIWLTER